MNKELKPCPFCGGEAFEYYSGSQFEFCEVVCKECGCRSKGKTEAEAIEAWNTRKPIDKVVEALEDEYDNAGRLTGYFYNHNTYETHGYMEGLKKAIEIVKGGADNV